MDVDVTAADSVRKSSMQALIKKVVDTLDATPSDSVKGFLLHLAWHEGMRVTKRKQVGGGPGRSFFQFEAPRAKDAVLHAKNKGWMSHLASASGKTETELETAANDITSGAWPAGNLIESLLAAVDKDLFATFMTRIVLRKIPAAIPTGNDSHAEYWADHWKIVFDSAADRTVKIAQFKANAVDVDGI